MYMLSEKIVLYTVHANYNTIHMYMYIYTSLVLRLLFFLGGVGKREPGVQLSVQA